MDYVECVTFSLQVGVFFLMQSFWNYLSNTVARKSFMGSFEFKFYIVWALGSMAMFPILQYVFRNDPIKRESVPQLAYGLEDMNALVSVILFSYAASFIILCVDGLTIQVISKNKFATDTIIANANICTVFLWLLLISIFHPRPQYSRNANDITSTNNDSSFRYSNANAAPRATTVDTGRAHNYVVNESVRSTNEDGSKFANRNMAIEDPYSNQPVMFSMMDVNAKAARQQRYASPTSPTNMGRYTPDHSQTTAPTRIRRPSWERKDEEMNHPSSPQQVQNPGQPGDQIVRDWLWQSPDRRNT
ncbi:hypothetical protein EDC94DRAFT_523974 [Helicostylum pulchrum]|nr:hypothetical protein EDC94DRAFT_523974 [Helicostylum pulchrum]